LSQSTIDGRSKVPLALRGHETIAARELERVRDTHAGLVVLYRRVEPTNPADHLRPTTDSVRADARCLLAWPLRDSERSLVSALAGSGAGRNDNSEWPGATATVVHGRRAR
jgi:hypothetical protein